MNKYSVVTLICILFAGFVFRLHGLTNPIADWHSWRQADTSAVSRDFAMHGFDLLHPTFEDLSNVPSGKDNPEGYRFVEFPLYNVLQAGLFVVFPFFTIEVWGRLVTIIASTVTALFIFLLVRRHAHDIVALSGAAVFALLPFSVYYGRTILPDPLMAMSVLLAIFFFDVWSEKKSDNKKKFVYFFYFLLAVGFSAASLLLKPYAIFFLLPIVVLAYQRFSLKMFLRWELYVLLILSVVPLIFWRWWMLQYPEGIPVNAWLFNGGNIRFKGAFFYWIFADRIARLIFGYYGIVFFVLGLLAVASRFFLKQKSDIIFFFSFIISSLLYIIIIARGNVQHDYYQILILPTLAIFAGFGISFLLRPPAGFQKTMSYVLFALCSIFTMLFGWYHVRDYFHINNPNIVVAGNAVDRLIPKDAKIIALYDGDTSFLYQTKRKGWASFQSSIPEMIKKGASYMVFVNPLERDKQGFGKQFSVVSSTDAYLILKLVP